MENMWRICWSIFIFFYHFTYFVNEISACMSDKDCRHDQVCQEKICKKCIKCEFLFRKGNDCERDLNKCGPCLQGYEETSVTNFSNILKPCRPEKNKSNMCTNDWDCPIGSYCYEKFCAVCFNCTLLNKLPPSNGCAKDFNKCGFCIEGFDELLVTTNSYIKPCERNIANLSNSPKLILSISNLLPFCILLVLAAVFIRLIFRKYKERNCIKTARSEQPLHPSAPPFFVLDIPESVECERENEKCSKFTFTTESKQQANTARIFKQPNALYYFADESADDTSDNSNDSNEEDSGPPQRSSEPEHACSQGVFLHGCAETLDHISLNHEVSESTSNVRQLNVSVDNIDSGSVAESRPEDGSSEEQQNFPQTEDSNSQNS